ncbi:MAG: phosphopentomutase [Oscillospiraceae bacterium]|jgi:phosphopentomutase|nr:phosphopentomutase [Oscillospiraceae bacterium]
MKKRVFLFVLDSFGIGEAPDAAAFGDAGANTIASVATSDKFQVPNMAKLGLFNLDGVACGQPVEAVSGGCARLHELSMGKDTTIGHWEIGGIVSPRPLPTFPDGFPADFMAKYEAAVGRKCLCNKPYSGTQVLVDYGMEHMETGALIVYTSADSVFQVAANEALVPVQQLYEYCQIARNMLTGELGVGRVIARPFVGDSPETFKRTANRHDFSLDPPAETMLTVLERNGLATISVGKIFDIFNGANVSESNRTTGNDHGMQVALEMLDRDFEGLCFINLVEFDMTYGHRRNIPGYAQALTDFDRFLDKFLPAMGPEDVLMITADHGCDPGFLKTTDHTREYVPWLVYGAPVKAGVNLGTIDGFTAIAGTVCEYLGVETDLRKASCWDKLKA